MQSILKLTNKTKYETKFRNCNSRKKHCILSGFNINMVNVFEVTPEQAKSYFKNSND